MAQVLTRSTSRARKLSVPGPGSTVALATEERACFVRRAVYILEEALLDQRNIQEAWASLLGGRARGGTLANGTPSWTLAAWGLVAIRIVGRLQGALNRDSSLKDAERWFTGSVKGVISVADLVDEIADRTAVKWLERVDHDENLHDLLPYVLDAHGPGSRASVMRDPNTQQARTAKRAGGVFYTPSDVAEYIAAEVIRCHGGSGDYTRYLDPACGTGVFLKAVLSKVRADQNSPFDPFSFAEQSLFGFDIDTLAVQSACFVLLAEVLTPETKRTIPWGIWHGLRLNIVTADALTIECRRSDAVSMDERTDLRERLKDGYLPPCKDIRTSRPSNALFDSVYYLSDILPEIANGADVVLGNPPYAPIGERDDAPSIEGRFSSFTGQRKSDLYPLFVEMMWRLANRQQSAAGMVLPLSLSFHSGPQMRACRRAIANSGGCWRFAFFDREPHALFGEDVKTRNTIAFRSEHAGDRQPEKKAAIETGPLRKWTSRTRSSLFTSITYTRLEDSSIEEGIPKLSGHEAAHAFAMFKRSPHRMRSLCLRTGSCSPADASVRTGGARVFVAGTAYNFLNVFRTHESLPPQKTSWSESKLHCFEFPDEAMASVAMAILSSRVTYWLWHVLGDGFHVSRRFLEELPFSQSSFSLEEQESLSRLGADLWCALQDSQIVSVNRGRQTVAYRPHGCENLRDRIDAILLATAGIEARFGNRLREFVQKVVTVDGDDERRQHFAEQFSEWETQS